MGLVNLSSWQIDRVDLPDLPHPTHRQTRLNKEQLMTELSRFRPGYARRLSASFPFERASLDLFARFKKTRPTLPAPALRSEWRDPVVLKGGQV